MESMRIGVLSVSFGLEKGSDIVGSGSWAVAFLGAHIFCFVVERISCRNFIPHFRLYDECAVLAVFGSPCF